MADVLDFTGVTAEELTEAQIRGIIRRIDLNIYNILADKHGATPYAEFGQAGHRADPDKGLKTLYELRKSYELMLNQVPCELHSVYDDPDVTD